MQSAPPLPSRRQYKGGPRSRRPSVAPGQPERPHVAMRPERDANFPTVDEDRVFSSVNSAISDANDSFGQNVTWIDYASDELAVLLNVYYTPLLIIFGCVGNLLSIFVFYTSKLRLQSTSVYLSALALSDTLFLLQLLLPWLDAIQFSSVFYKTGFCQLIVYVSYVTCCLSTWIVVAFTVERFVAVLHPLRKSLVCTVNRAKYIVLSLTLATLILNIPVLKFTSSSAHSCSINEEFMEHAARFNLVDTAVAFTVPLAAVVVLNARIMVGVYRLERARHQLLKVEQQGGARPPRLLHPPGLRSQHRVTRMLLIVSSVFVVLNLPAYTMRVLAYTYDTDTADGGRWAAFQQLALTFFNTNFGINFMLYCLSGQNFRRALWNSIPWLRHRAIRSVAARRTACNPARASSISTSFVSAGTEGPNTIAMSSFNVDRQSSARRQRSDPVIKRWTFDNSRQRRTQNGQPTTSIELETYNVGHCSNATEHSI